MVLIQKRKVIATVLAALLMAWWLFYPSERDRLDAEAKRLCAIDGGVRVYETVKLPAEMFNGDDPIIPGKEFRGDLPYYSNSIFFHIAGKRSAQDGPSLHKTIRKFFRASDEKLLGEIISYGSAGRSGIYLAFVHDYGYGCPDYASTVKMMKQIFVKGESK